MEVLDFLWVVSYCGLDWKTVETSNDIGCVRVC